MRIIIAGSGTVGATLAEQLADEGHDLTMVDKNTARLSELMERYDLMTAVGNCASMDTLRDAGVQNAELLIATTDSDELNLLCCMTAHHLNKRIHTIARIKDPEYTNQVYTMSSSFGISLCFNPEKQAAIEIDRLLKYPGFMKRESFASGKVEIVEIKIDEKSKLKDVTLMSIADIVKCKVLVCAVLRDGKAITPSGTFTLRQGDRIFVTAPSENLSLLLKNLGLVSQRAKKVMMLGADAVGYYLAEILENRKIDLKIIEKDRARCEKLSALLENADVIEGDASDYAFLESEGLSSSDALICLTGRDEMNMVSAIYGGNSGVPLVITRLGKVDDGKVTENLPLGRVISPRKLCCNTIVRYVRALEKGSGAATTIHTIAEGSVEAVEFPVKEDTLHKGEPLKTIKLRPNILVACIIRYGKTEIPDGNSSFKEGDSVIVVSGRSDVLSELNDIFA
ncbi:MAG: Trk system potassium transporter TrkA [Clostridia bacterium]|nr:Trk system potassium transporter TrkA [Clostridia bacterium]